MHTGVGAFTATRLLTNGTFRFLYPFLPLIAADLGVGEGAEGLFIVALATGGVLAPVTERFATRGRPRPRRLATVGLIGAAAGAAFAASAPIVVVALLGFLLLGTSKPLVDVASIAYVSDRVPLHRRARATSIMELTWAGGLLVVAPVAGVLADVWSWRVPLAVLALAVATTPLWLRPRLDVDGHDVLGRDETSAAAAAADEPGAARRGRRQYLFAAAAIFVTLEATFSVFSLWLVDTFDAGATALGAFVAITSLGELGGSMLVAGIGDRIGTVRMTLAGLTLAVTAIVALPFTTVAVVAAGCMAIALLGVEVAIVASLPIAAEVDPANRATFLTRMVAAASVARAIAAGVAPLLLARVGIGANVAASVIAGVAAMLLLLAVVRALPRLDTRRAGRAA